MVVRSTVLSFLSSSITDFLIIESGSRMRITSYRERIRSCLRDHLRVISLCIWKSVTIFMQIWQASELSRHLCNKNDAISPVERHVKWDSYIIEKYM